MSAPLKLPTGEALAVLRVVLVVALLLAAGGGLYAGFVKHVLDRGDHIVDVSVKSKAARPPLQLGASALVCFAGSGIASFAKPVRGRRLAPLLGIGLPLVPAGLVGLTAFSLGRTSLTLALVVLAPSVLTMAVACAVPPKPYPGLGRFLLRSWMATGFLVGLVLLALSGLELAETARPRVPWASVFAALAIGTLVQLAARYVGMHGSRPSPVAVDHEQKREAHETDAIRAVAARLHPFVEEGRDAVAYDALASELATVGKLQAPAAPELPTGPHALPPAAAGCAAVLRAAAVACPVAVLVPVFGWPAAVVAFGLVLPFTRMALEPRKDRLPRGWWLAGAALMALGGAWAGSFLQAPALGLARLTLPAAGVLALPHLVLFLASLRRTPLPGHIAYLRLEHARRLARTWPKQLVGGLAVAGAALGLPLVLWAASQMTGLRIPSVQWPILLAFAAGGALWAVASALCGPAAVRHRARLGAEHDARVAARAAAHRAFLTRLEMT